MTGCFAISDGCGKVAAGVCGGCLMGCVMEFSGKRVLLARLIYRWRRLTIDHGNGFDRALAHSRFVWPAIPLHRAPVTRRLCLPRRPFPMDLNHQVTP